MYELAYFSTSHSIMKVYPFLKRNSHYTHLFHSSTFPQENFVPLIKIILCGNLLFYNFSTPTNYCLRFA